MHGIRRFGLHPPQEETPPDGQGTVDMTSFRHTLIALSGNQTAEAQLYQADNTWAHPGKIDDNVSMSSGSLSPDLEDLWKYGCPRSPDWDSEGDGEVVDGAQEKEGSDMWNVQYVLQGPLLASVRVFLVSDL